MNLAQAARRHRAARLSKCWIPRQTTMQTVQARSFSTSPYRSDVPRRKSSKSDHKGRFVPNSLASDALVEASGASKANISSTASTRTRTRKSTITVPYKPVERKRAALPQLDLVTGKVLNSSDQDLKAEWNMAVKERSFPDTPLAKEIFNNMKAYPDDIVLTKVGMFYEVSLSSERFARRLYSLRSVPIVLFYPSISSGIHSRHNANI